jgi:hypothetical protein
MHVDSADPEVRGLLRDIATTVAVNGGRIHPALVVHHQGAHLWLSLPRSANPFAGQRLDRPAAEAPQVLEIPDELHIPVVAQDWDDDSEVLRYSGGEAALTKAQGKILHAMIDLFNACDKVRTIGQAYPAAVLHRDPELLALIREARPTWGEGDPAAPSRLFLNSRLRTEMGDGEEGPVGYLMPMIDMLNHHPHGSRYERDAANWVIRAHHPDHGDQLFVRYNKADALGVALGLGYYEPATRFVSSVACDVEAPGVGTITVAGVGVGRRPLPVPAVGRTAHGLRIVGLQLGAETLANLITLLALPLRTTSNGLDHEKAELLAAQVVHAIVGRNRDYYRRLAAVPNLPDDPAGLRRLMRSVAGHQLKQLDALDGVFGRELSAV